MKNKDIIVLYHANCPDGFTSAWAANTVLADTADYIPVSYGGEIPEVTNKTVYILDFSFKRDVLVDLAGKAKSITLLDHHKTAEADLKDLNCGGLDIIFDMNRSGAGITWDYFHPDQVGGNWFVNYIQDRDLWQFKLPNSKIVNAYLGSLPHKFEAYTEAFNKGHDNALTCGEGCLSWMRYYIENTKRNATTMEFMGYANIPVVNASYSAISEVLGELSENHEFAVGWGWKDNTIGYSLRSRHGFDVSALAKSMGGGGHQAAAGFSSSKFPWEL